MNQLTTEQIKTLEDAFVSYPKGFSTTGKYRNMGGIQEQLYDLEGEPGLIFYISKVNVYEDGREHFVMEKMEVGETK